MMNTLDKIEEAVEIHKDIIDVMTQALKSNYRNSIQTDVKAVSRIALDYCRTRGEELRKLREANV